MIQKKHLKNIEMDKIVEMAVQYAVCDETRQMLREESPMTAAEDVRYLLKQTDIIAKNILKNARPRISSCAGANSAVDRAAKGGLLSMGELLSVNGALRNFSTLVGWFFPQSSQAERIASVMDDLFYAISPQPALEKDIPEAILSDTEMADTASDELYTLRRKIRAAEGSVRDKLDAVIKNQNSAKYLRDAIVSIRNGRFVVPVKAEYRAEVSGIVHDVSSSGGTFFVEPAAVVEANAKILQLRNAEQAEIERILGEFSQRVAEIAPMFEASYSAMLEIDRRIAKAELGLSINGICPKVRDTQEFSLVKARHPLLAKSIAVPIDVSLGYSYDTLVVTGPNTGGKTVSLKTAGLLCVMAQMGYLLPASDATEVCVFEQVLADIGDEQSIEQNLSTFSGHMKNVTEILRTVNSKSLVLLDELGAGTDPAEGAALAIAIIEKLRSSGALVMGTTHYAELKMFALETEGVQNAASEFDIETLRPTYRLLIGVPGRSNAFLIGEKLGIPKQVIEGARSHLSGEQQRFESVLTQLEDMKLEMKAQEEEIEQLRNAAQHQIAQAKEKCDALINQGEAELAEARRRAKALSDEVQNTAYTLMDEMKRLEKEERISATQKAQRARQIANKDATTLQRQASQGEVPQESVHIPLESVQVGQEVWVPQMKKIATVVAPMHKNGSVEVRMGAIKTKLKLNELSAMPHGATAQAQKQKPSRKTAVLKSGGASEMRTAQAELNLLGRTVDEALMETDMFIDNALMSGLSTVYIIHGRGTGALRNAIGQHLRSIKAVKSHRLGRYGEGEDGVTVVEISR